MMSVPGVPELAIAVRTLIALVFLSAALGKMRHWTIFQGVLGNYRLLPEALVAPVARLLPPFEAVLGLALLVGVPAVWPELAAAVLLLLFAAAMAINLRRGRAAIDCGCFQSALKQTLRWTLVLRNLAMVLLLALAVLVDGPASDLWEIGNGVLTGGVLFLLLQSFTIFWSIVPAWRRSHAHVPGGAE